jgi:hypothetical protein
MGSGLVHPLLRAAERMFVSHSRPVSAPRLFILGLPRWGTTLVYQYIVHRLKVALLTNGVLRLEYESFCATPDSVVDLLAPALGELQPANPPVRGFDLVYHRPRNVEEEELLAMVEHE